MSIPPASQQCSIYFGTPLIRESLPAQHSGDAELLPSPRYLDLKQAKVLGRTGLRIHRRRVRIFCSVPTGAAEL